MVERVEDTHKKIYLAVSILTIFSKESFFSFFSWEDQLYVLPYVGYTNLSGPGWQEVVVAVLATVAAGVAAAAVLVAVVVAPVEHLVEAAGLEGGQAEDDETEREELNGAKIKCYTVYILYSMFQK